MYKRPITYAIAIFAACLLTACASRNDVCTNCLDRTDERLMDAAAELYPDAVERLLDEGASINAKDHHGETPLMKALRQPQSRSLEQIRPLQDTVSVLLNAGADIDVVNIHGKDTLKLAQETGNIEVIKLFDQHMSQSEKDTMFMRALADQQYDMAWYLLESGANPSQVNNKKQSALHLALNTPKPHNQLIQRLLKTNDAALKDDYGTTPVMTACANAAPTAIIKQLLENDANINDRFHQKNLLYLVLTAKTENIELIKHLLKSGFSANETAPDGRPFIVIAAKMDRIRSAKALADAGADTAVLDKYGQGAYRSRLNILAF